MVVVGIDLGTCNSVCFVEAGRDYEGKIKYSPVENEFVRYGKKVEAENERFHPSYVQYNGKGDIAAVGIRAKLLAYDAPKLTVYDSKRLIGRRFDDETVQEFKQILEDRGHFVLCEDEKGQSKIKVGNKELSPEEIAAEVILEMLKDALEQYDITIGTLVVSHPAYFNNVQRLKTKKAAVLAIEKLQAMKEYSGKVKIKLNDKPEYVEDIRLISEPTAALITNMARNNKKISEDDYVIVLDIGAGTLDITIGTVNKSSDPITRKEVYSVEVKTIHGNTDLGGRDMDQKLVRWAIDQLKKENHEIEDVMVHELRDAVEKAKIRLSKRENTNIRIGHEGIEIPLSREKLEEILSPIIEQVRKEIRSSLNKAEIRKKDLAAVIMVGGPSQMPCIRRIVKEELGLEVKDVENWNPMLCVAEGATRFGSKDGEGKTSEPSPFDYHIAVEMFEGVNIPTKLVSVGDMLPIRGEKEIMVSTSGIDVSHNKFSMVESIDGKNKLVNEIIFSVPSGTGSEIKKVEYPWSKFKYYNEALNKEIELRYDKINIKYEITKEGLLLKPKFSNPDSGKNFEYTDIPPLDLGEIKLTDPTTFERNWENMAKKDLQKLEDNIEKEIEMKMTEKGYNRQQAEFEKIQEIIGGQIPFEILWKLAEEAIEMYTESGGQSSVINDYKTRLSNAIVETQHNKTELWNILGAICNALRISNDDVVNSYNRRHGYL